MDDGIDHVHSTGSHVRLRWLLVELVKLSFPLFDLALADNLTRKLLHPLQQTPRLMWTRQDDGEPFYVRESR